jgi:Transglutaminase-like superfamily
MWFRNRFVVSLLAFVTGYGRDNQDRMPSSSSSTTVQAVTVDPSPPPLPCRSNATHIAWRGETTTTPTIATMATLPVFGRRKAQTLVVTTTTNTTTTPSSSCTYQTRAEATRECMMYLQQNLMAFDLPFQQTMGFSENDSNNNDDPNGLDNGLIGPTVSLALDAKVLYPWTDMLSKDMFQNYVLNYANFNEARTNWRPLLVDALDFPQSDIFRKLVVVDDQDNPTTLSSDHHHHPAVVLQQEDQDWDSIVSSIVTWVNQVLWTKLGRGDGHPIYFKSSQTPLIFDPMSTIAFGYASCTGTSILFSNALRAVGIASRVVGTPAWYGNATQGNHNWVEVYLPHTLQDWKFLEPSPALAHVDTLENNPCHRWFCTVARYPASQVYAARLTKQPKAEDPSWNSSGEGGGSLDEVTTTYVPLPWEWDCKDVPGVDRTQYYVDVCGVCHE